MDPERGALVQSAVQMIARAEGISHADALVRMAEIALAAVTDSQNAPRELRGDERAAVVVHLTAAAVPAEPAGSRETRSAERTQLGDGDRSGDGDEARSAERGRPYAHLAGGPGLPERVVKRLLCAARIRTVVHDQGGNVRDLGRSHRLVTDRQFRALLLRDGGCTHPGCGTSRGLEAHHVRHWLNGGPTDLTNLVLLCRAHHHAHHDGQFHIQARHGRFRFTRADGQVLPDHVNPAAHIDTATPLEHEHPGVADNAATTRWTGERLDPWAIGVLAERRQRHRPAS